MNYYLKISRHAFNLFFWFVISIVWVIKIYLKHDGSTVWFWLSLSIFFGFSSLRLLYRKLSKRPILTVNEYYIYEPFKNIKYYWKDINEIIEIGDRLHIDLYEPSSYLSKIRDPIDKIIIRISLKFFKERSPYFITLHEIDIKSKKEFLETLNNYSIASEDSK